MRDFNFFSSSKEAAKAARTKKMIISLFIIVFLGIISGLYYMTVVEIDEIETEIASLKEYINSDEVKTQIEEIKERRNELEVIKGYYRAVEAVTIDLKTADVITSGFLEIINTTLPQGVKFRNMIVSPGNMSFNGIADSRVTVAELYHNLKGLDLFYELNIGTIAELESVQENGTVLLEYTFDVQCLLKGGVEQ